MAIDLHNKIKISDLEKLLRNTLDALWNKKSLSDKLPPLMIWGAPGIGKSTVIRDLAKEYNVGFIDVRLAQREPIDIRGLPVPGENGMEWQVSSEWPRDKESKGIILFDELTSADRSLQVAAYEFILDRRLGDLYKVPEGWYICAAGNRVEDRAVSTTMSSALANRFLHVELESDVENWIDWALQHKIHPSVSGFIRFRPGMLFNQENENLERGWPTPRSWERVSTMIKILPDDQTLLKNAVYGLVGNRAGIEFMAFYKTTKSLEIKEMMINPDYEIIIPEKADLRYALCAGVAYYLCEGNSEEETNLLLDGFFRISLALGSDFAAMLMMDAVKRGNHCFGATKIYKHPLFKDWTSKHGNTFGKVAKL